MKSRRGDRGNLPGERFAGQKGDHRTFCLFVCVFLAIEVLLWNRDGLGGQRHSPSQRSQLVKLLSKVASKPSQPLQASELIEKKKKKREMTINSLLFVCLLCFLYLLKRGSEVG